MSIEGLQADLEKAALSAVPDKAQAATVLLMAAVNLLSAEFGEDAALIMAIQILQAANAAMIADHAH